MSTNSLFLERLNLDESADERAIRRAYARELKLIDQERSPQQFQELRETYENALQWAREKIAFVNLAAIDEPEAYVLATEGISTDDAVIVHKVAPQEELDTTIAVNYAKIYQELEEFRLYCDGMRRRDEHLGDLITWQRKLEEILARPEFDNLHARRVFEANIIDLLVRGWKPGHETLFVTAVKAFRWKEEPSRLRGFGESGAVIDMAVLQYLMFQDLKGSPQYQHFRKAVARLRIAKAPTIKELVVLYPYMEILVQHYPIWMSLITNINSLEMWKKKDRWIPTWVKSYGRVNAPEGIHFVPNRFSDWDLGSKLGLIFFVVCFLFIVLSMAMNVSGRGVSRTGDQYGSSVHQVSDGSKSQPHISSNAKLVPQVDESRSSSGPEMVQVQAIYPRLSFVRKQEGTVMLRVLINERGKANEVEIVESSGFPRLDAAALEAAQKGVYKPYVEYGQAKPIVVSFPIVFSLENYKK